MRVAVETPQHSGLGAPLDYLSERPLTAGTFVRVPLGRREVPGVVWPGPSGEAAPDALKSVAAVLDTLPPVSADWCRMVEFAATYYQRGVGELALSVLPPELRKLDDAQVARRVAALRRRVGAASPGELAKRPATDRPAAKPTAPPDPPADMEADLAADPPPDLAADPPADLAADPPADPPADPAATARPPLTADQSAALQRLDDWAAEGKAPTVLLHGVTGSGKTEVYLRAAESVLAAGRQALVLVPEINLTPQLEARFAARFGAHRLVSLHSGLTPAQRLRHWLAAHLGLADLVLGTRLAVFASMPRLGLIVVDEEHDPSYKQQEGARYSARDLAVYRGRQAGAAVLLGSATPSLETWQRAQTGRYERLSLPQRIGAGALPHVRLVDMNLQPRPARGAAGSTALAPPLVAALQDRLARGEQSLVFLNRRGYAPVLHCPDCGWKSGCPHCSAWRVFHKLDRSLRCHHCGLSERVPRACPDCGNLDIAPVGRGTERLEEQLAALLPDARVARIDADSTRQKGALEAQLGAVHAGEVDVLVGTQMVTKGHDFRRITLVAAVNPDGALFSSDFRAAERLFALLMQAAGRGGRDAAQSARSEMLVQTWHPAHPLFRALAAQDFEAFAASQLKEREMAGLPPFAHLALLRADARTQEAALAFLQSAAEAAAELGFGEAVSVYPPVPMDLARVADVERAQMLVESRSRAALQAFLAQWLPALHALRRARAADAPRILRWAIDVDPLAI